MWVWGCEWWPKVMNMMFSKWQYHFISYSTLHRQQQVRLQENASPDILCRVSLPPLEIILNIGQKVLLSLFLWSHYNRVRPVYLSSRFKRETPCESLTSTWLSSSQQRRSDPLHNTCSTSSPKLSYPGYIKLISCENSRLVCIKCTVNQRQQSWQTLLDACQIFARILQ